jgi:murein DD-endopeptidase
MRLLIAALALLGAVACSGPQGLAAPAPHAGPAWAAGPSDRQAAARTAEAMIGVPYRTRGTSPNGFDCSGLVVYSYAAAGVSGLPHSAASLEQVAQPVSLRELEPGDLLFFTLAGKKTSHVAMYVGDRAFVHAPSSGKRVERVSFDHVYWATRLGRAGRLGH